MVLLICGGRWYVDYQALCAAIALLPFVPDVILHGDAKGADTLAKTYARENNIHCASVPALWKQRGKAAGGDRNSAMLLLKPDYCLALPGGAGTADMVRKCREQNIPTWEPYK